jgi:hypothetical protein
VPTTEELFPIVKVQFVFKPVQPLAEPVPFDQPVNDDPEAATGEMITVVPVDTDVEQTAGHVNNAVPSERVAFN